MPPMNEPTIQKPLRPLGHLNKKILESAGDIGVPRIQKVAPTVAKEFNLSSASRPNTARKKVDVPDESTRPLYSSFGSKAGAAAFAKPSVVAKPKAAPPKPAAKPPVPKAAAAAPKVAAAAPKAAASAPKAATKVESVDVSESTASEPPATEPVDVSEPAAAEPVPILDEYAPILDVESAWTLAHEEKARREAAAEEAWREAHEEEARRAAILAEPLTPMDAAWVEAHYDNEFRERYGPKAHNDAMAMDAWDEAHEEKARREAAEKEKTNVRRVFAKDALPSYLADAEAEEGEASDDEADSDYAPTPKEVKTRAFAAIKAAGTPVAAAAIEAAASEPEEAIAAAEAPTPAACEEAPAPVAAPVAAPAPTPVAPTEVAPTPVAPSPVAPSPAKKVLASPVKAMGSPAVRQSPRRQPASAKKGPATNEEKLAEAMKALLAAEPSIGVKKIVEKLQEANLGFEVSAKAVRAIRQQM